MGICENNPEESYFANVQVPMYLAKAAKGRKLICFSSDQVYSGCDDDGPYAEENVKPANVYATHKLEMEQRVLDIEPSAVMLRAEWMYDMETTKDNYFTLLNKEKTVYFSSQEFRGITYLKEVAENIGVAKSTYSLYESGNREPNVNTIKKIADCLNVSADTLLGLNDELTTLAAHFDGKEYTEDELNEIRQFAEFVKNKRK